MRDQRNRRLVGAWLVVWGVLLLLVSNHVLLGWEHVWPLILTVSGVVCLRVFQSRLTPEVVFAGSFAILLGLFLTLFSSGLLGWSRMAVLWPSLELIVGVALVVAAGRAPARHAGVIVGALIVLMSASSFLYETGTVNARVAMPFIRFWPLVLILAGFVLMKRQARREGTVGESAHAARALQADPEGALAPDLEHDILRKVRAAPGRSAGSTMVRELKARFRRFSWVGIYRLHGDTLTLDELEYMGPSPEHRRIRLAEGVCGAAARSRETIIVPDVRQDSRYLACSPAVRSEIVVPIVDGGSVIGVLDVDSEELDAFSEEDRRFLESLVAKASSFIREEPVAAT